MSRAHRRYVKALVAMAGLLAKTTGLRSWWGEGAVIAASMRASCPAARQAGTASTAGATQQPAQGGRSTGGAFHAAHLAEKKAISPQRSRQTVVSSGSQSLREDSGWRLGTSKPLEFCRNKTCQSNTKTAPPPPWAVSPIHYSNHI